MPPSLTGTVLKKKWKLGALVGTGGCAEVYEAVSTGGSERAGAAGPFVAKVAPLAVGLPPAISKGKKRKKTEQEKHADMIYYEYTLYKGFLADHGGVAEIPAYGYGEDHNLRYLVMSRLGPDVEAAQQEGKSKAWSLPRKVGYARQMLALLRLLHDRCKMVFVDVKPENFMFGLPGSADEDKIFLIDFGLSYRFTGSKGAIKPQGQSAQVQGTPEFLSLKCHAGASAGRCDDLESLGYVIVSMLKEGSTALPWSGSTSVANGLATKKSTTLEELCKGCPPGMLQYMEAVRGMEYEDTPGYDKLDAMLRSMEIAGGTAAAGRGAAGGGGKSKDPIAKSKVNAAGSKGASGKDGSASVSKRTTKGRSAPKAVASQEEEEEEEVEVCEVEAKGKGRAAKGQRGSAAAAATAAAASPKQRATTAVRRSRRLSSPKDGEFFDALQEHDSNEEGEDDDELEVTKVVRGGQKRGASGVAVTTGRAAARKTSASSKATAKPRSVFVLEVLSGPHEGQTLRLNAGGAEALVGRNAPRKNGLRLDKDFEVSDKHAILRPQADGISVEDLGSLNGSFVNEDRLEGIVVIRGGDVLQVGQTVVEIAC